jgi:lysophospholipase L1-like esterase
MFSIPRSLAAALVLIAPIAAATLPVRAADLGPLPRVARLMAAGLTLHVTALGSSSTEGVGASSAAASYPSRLQVDLAALLPEVPVVVLNRGIGGQDADDMVARLPALLAERPDLVIWQTGSNDPLRGVPLDRFEAETRRGIASIRDTGADVILMEPQLCRRLSAQANAERFRDAVRRIGAEMGVPVVRRYDLMRGWLDKGLISQAQMLSGDGLHMADAGYAMLAKEVAREIVARAAESGRVGHLATVNPAGLLPLRLPPKA